jgi:hypothetical protein
MGNEKRNVFEVEQARSKNFNDRLDSRKANICCFSKILIVVLMKSPPLSLLSKDYKKQASKASFFRPCQYRASKAHIRVGLPQKSST